MNSPIYQGYTDLTCSLPSINISSGKFYQLFIKLQIKLKDTFVVGLNWTYQNTN